MANGSYAWGTMSSLGIPHSASLRTDMGLSLHLHKQAPKPILFYFKKSCSANNLAFTQSKTETQREKEKEIWSRKYMVK